MNVLKRHSLQGFFDDSCSITSEQAQRKAQKVLSLTLSSPDEGAGEVRKTVLNYLFPASRVLAFSSCSQRLCDSGSCKNEVLTKKPKGVHHNALLCLGRVRCGATVTDGLVTFETKCGESQIVTKLRRDTNCCVD